MQSTFIEYVYLILIILGLVMLANKFRVAYPIVLVLGGLAISFIPAFGNVTISPELVFFIFLPPLLYEAAWQVSWKEFWKYRRIIASFAFPIVIITSCVVAFVSTALIPGFTLALGFLLGGIISPPDAIAATTIMRQAKAPKLLTGVTEGESLLNDATSLIVFRFALAAVLTGQFHLGEASINFFLVVVLGILIGLVVGLIFYCIHRWLPVTPSVEIALTIVTPYCMYYAAEHFHYSGVLAVVSGGLFLSGRRLSMLNYMSRIQGVNVWNSLVFVLNGLVFLLIGLQLPSIVNQLGDISLASAIFYGLVISLVLIVARLLCTYGAAGFTIFMSRFITVADNQPGWKAPLIFGWAGIRGVVSLAAALSIPLLGSNGENFPYRNLILFITFIVILVTLVLQGLTLPWLIKKLKMEDRQTISAEQQEKIIQKKIAHTSLNLLEEKFGKAGLQNEHLKNLKSRLKTEMDFFNRELSDPVNTYQDSRKEFQQIYLELLEHQRKSLDKINQNSEFDEEIIRKYQFLVDMEEYKVREKFSQES
ncbi:MAG TPA: Na+/H+ antiporter [Bacteroidia bacterium]|nr:Na+/H+ antiporter [Bacteroidia bacterium]